MRLRSALRLALQSADSTVKLSLDKNAIPTIGYHSKNWGDALNPILIQKISGRTPLIVTKHTYNVRNASIYSAIGSVLERTNINNCGHGNLIVWGTGFISGQGRLKVQPKEILCGKRPTDKRTPFRAGTCVS
jgi:pyruvyltransferase